MLKSNAVSALAILGVVAGAAYLLPFDDRWMLLLGMVAVGTFFIFAIRR